MSVRRMVPFILINIVVSATVVLLILFIWDNRPPAEETAETTTEPQPTSAVAAGVGTSQAAQTQASEPAAGGDSGDGLTRHTVQPGESLGVISQQYDVPIADIMAANGISDPNFLQVDQVLIIPVGGLPTATPEPAPTITPNIAPTPIATIAPAEGEAVVEITEVVGVGILEDEAVSITNSGERPIALLDWELSDEDGNVYPFGQITLFGESAVSILVHTQVGQDDPTNLYWDLDEPIWESGEVVTLTDAEGTVRVTYTIP